MTTRSVSLRPQEYLAVRWEGYNYAEVVAIMGEEPPVSSGRPYVNLDESGTLWLVVNSTPIGVDIGKWLVNYSDRPGPWSSAELAGAYYTNA